MCHFNVAFGTQTHISPHVGAPNLYRFGEYSFNQYVSMQFSIYHPDPEFIPREINRVSGRIEERGLNSDALLHFSI